MFKALFTHIEAARLIGAALTFFVSWGIATVLQKVLINYIRPQTHSPELVDFLGSLVKYVILLLALFSALTTLGINVQGLLAGLGLTGFAIGFALRDTLANFIAGVSVLLYRPFHLGDYIKITSTKPQPDEGIVRHIDLRYITLENKEGTALVPNSTLFTNTIVIYKKSPHSS